LSSTDEAAPPEAPPTDDVREAMLAAAKAELGDALLESHIRPGDDLWIRVPPSSWRHAAEVCRDKLGCTYFAFLSAIDWLPSPYGRSEDSPFDEPAEAPEPGEIVTGYAGGETRFQVFARFEKPGTAYGVTVKADLPPDDLRIPTLIPVFAGANWHEREAWEMYGIDFAEHPHLVHLYLPGAFEGNPLRKDFPLLPRLLKPWPGIVDVEPMPEEDEPEEGAEGAEGEASEGSEP
jgi:NADH-quinone oxidoreductase subunit C